MLKEYTVLDEDGNGSTDTTSINIVTFWIVDNYCRLHTGHGPGSSNALRIRHGINSSEIIRRFNFKDI